MIQNLKKIICDECMRRGHQRRTTMLLDANTALEQADAMGWYCDGNTELCPEHARRSMHNGSEQDRDNNR